MNHSSDRAANLNSNLNAGSIARQDIATLCHQATVYFTQGNFAESIALCHQVITIKPDCVLAYDILGASLMSQKKVAAAIRAFSQAIAIEPKSVKILVKLGNSLVACGQLDEAIVNYKKALEINPNWADISRKLCHLLSQQNRWEEALDCWIKVAQIAPTTSRAESFIDLGNFYATQGNFELAIACYRHLISQTPDSKPAYLNLAIALKKQGKIPEAIATCIQLLQIQPSADEAYDYLSILLTKLDRNDEAIACYLRLIPLHLIREFSPSTVDLPVTSTLEAKIPVLYPQFPPTENPHPNLRETEAENIKPFVAVIPNGRAWGDNYTRAIITSEGQLLEDVSAGSPGLIVSSNCLPPPRTIAGTVAFLAKNYCYNYYHWMFEFLPQIELLRRSGIALESIDKFAINNCNYQFQRETLSWLGIPPTKIVETDSNPHIQADRLLASNAIRESTQWACDFLRKEFLNKSAIGLPKKQRIFISRKHRRKVINEDEVLAVLSKFGFEVVEPESMSVAEQISLFAAADVIIATHGAALTNTVFCRSGTKVIEILAPDYLNPCYRKLSEQIDLEYWEFIGERLPDRDSDTELGEGRSHQFHSVFDDIFVNIDALIHLLKFARI